MEENPITVPENNTAETTSQETKSGKPAEREKQALEIKVACLSKGVLPNAVEDVIALAARLTYDNTSIEKAVDNALEKCRTFLGKPHKKVTAGVRTGSRSLQECLSGGSSTAAKR